MQKHWIDTNQLLTTNKQPKCDGIYKIFERYSGQSPNDMKESLMDRICDHCNELMTNMSIALQQRHIMFTTWLSKVYED